MKCPICKYKTKVLDTRKKRGGKRIVRRRICLNCKTRFKTFETYDFD